MRGSSDLPPGWVPGRYASLARKVRKLDESTLLGYADMAGTGMAQAFADFRRDSDMASLDEIEEGLMTLWAVSRELRARAH